MHAAGGDLDCGDPPRGQMRAAANLDMCPGAKRLDLPRLPAQGTLAYPLDEMFNSPIVLKGTFPTLFGKGVDSINRSQF
jgi:hypothetical protein